MRKRLQTWKLSDKARRTSIEEGERRRKGDPGRVAHDSAEFARNLSLLTLMHGYTRRQVAQKIGANYQWYRRIVTRGLRQLSAENQAHLQALADLFGVGRVEEFWRTDLIVFKVNKPTDRDTQLIWYQNELGPYGAKLGRLLASGEHDYLRELIDRLYATLRKDLPSDPEPGTGYWSSESDEEEEIPEKVELIYDEKEGENDEDNDEDNY